MCTSAARNALADAHDRADVEVVLPVLDRHVEVVPAGVEVGDDRLEPPVAVAVHDVAPVALGEQPRVVLLARRATAPSHGPTPTSAGPCGIGSYGARSLVVVGHAQNAVTEAGARCGRVRARTTRGGPCRRTASPVSRSSTGCDDLVRELRRLEPDAGGQVVGVDDDLHHPGQRGSPATVSDQPCQGISTGPARARPRAAASTVGGQTLDQGAHRLRALGGEVLAAPADAGVRLVVERRSAPTPHAA